MLGTGGANRLALWVASWNAVSSRSHASPIGSGEPLTNAQTTIPTSSTWASTSSGRGSRHQRPTAPVPATTTATTNSGPSVEPKFWVNPCHVSSETRVVVAATAERPARVMGCERTPAI